jgi:hypothetical protein
MSVLLLKMRPAACCQFTVRCNVTQIYWTPGTATGSQPITVRCNVTQIYWTAGTATASQPITVRCNVTQIYWTAGTATGSQPITEQLRPTSVTRCNKILYIQLLHTNADNNWYSNNTANVHKQMCKQQDTLHLCSRVLGSWLISPIQPQQSSESTVNVKYRFGSGTEWIPGMKHKMTSKTI